jgi:FolB domain-containing protein
VDTITIQDLAVLCHIGVPDSERANPQRLLITIEMAGNFSEAGASDDIEKTINYYDVSHRVTEHCEKGSFKLIERLAREIAERVLKEFRPQAVTIEIKKFILTDARHVSFRLSRRTHMT